MTVPELGPDVPRQGGAVRAAFGRLALRVMGWRIENAVPNVSRAVLIVAPHTSNWDFPIGLAAMFALRLRVNWLGKHTIFRYGLGYIWRALGGIAVDRSSPAGVVGRVIEEFRRRDQMLLGVAPEGTRRRVPQWKSGFYRIAQAARVPIAPLAFDYRTRTIAFFPLFEPTGDYEADLAGMQSRYCAAMAYRPENYGIALSADPGAPAVGSRRSP